MSGSSNSANFASAFQKLRERYFASVPEVLQTLSGLADQLDHAPASDEALAALKFQIHRMHGSAGSFGYPEVSELAGDMEDRVTRWTKDPSLELERRAMLTRAYIEACRSIFFAPEPPSTTDVATPADPFEEEEVEHPASAPDVIIVEDDAELAEGIESLTDRSIRVQSLRNGMTALQALKTVPPGDHPILVIVDLDLPGLDGHALHELLQVERPEVFAVVFMSAHERESEQLRAFTSGAMDFLVKPVNVRVLQAKVLMWLDLLWRMR